MPRRTRIALVSVALSSTALLATTLFARPAPLLSDWTIVGWNDLGMHCMDSDYTVFSILPPYNTINAQVIDAQGQFIDTPGVATVTYESIADPTGSINTTSAGKTQFWAYMASFFGVTVPVDMGLAGKQMPGANNTPRPMTWDPNLKWFNATGIPITPTDDAGHTQNYPMMRLVARDAAGTVHATTDIVLPVSAEMDCRACHASGAPADARPVAGWVNDANFERDYRLNILRLHDEKQATNPQYAAALTHFGFNPSGLSATVSMDGKSIL